MIVFQPGALTWELQIGRFYLHWPYWRFLRCGYKPTIGWKQP